jgi:uncharacterized coiled-coil protein SlyX
MVKYLLIDCDKITFETSDCNYIQNPINLKGIRETNISRNTQSYSSISFPQHLSVLTTLVIENENFVEFSFLDELKKYEKEKYKLLLNSFGEFEQINYAKESEQNTLYTHIILNGVRRSILKYPFQLVIFKNCLNLQKISGILESHQQIYDISLSHNPNYFEQLVNITNFNYFVWNCPKFKFEFKPLEFVTGNRSHTILHNGCPHIGFYISDKFQLIYKYTDVLLQHILCQQHNLIKSLTNDNKNLKIEYDTSNNVILEMTNKINALNKKLENTEQLTNLNHKIDMTNSKIDIISETINSVITRLNKLENQTEQNDKIVELNKQVINVKKTITMYANRLYKLENQTEQNDKIVELNKLINSIYKNINSLGERITKTENTISFLIDRLNKLENNTDQNDKIEELNKQVVSMHKIISTLVDRMNKIENPVEQSTLYSF